jgi:hypothetical protein
MFKKKICFQNLPAESELSRNPYLPCLRLGYQYTKTQCKLTDRYETIYIGKLIYKIGIN